MATSGCTVGRPSRDSRFASVLLLSPFPEDDIAVERALNGAAWQLCVARNFGEAVDVLEAEAVACIICDNDPRTGDWRELLRIVNECPDPPSFILASNRADEYLWAEVLNLGGYGLLPKPFDANEIYRVLAGARVEASRHSGRR